MKILFSPRFKREYRKLEKGIQNIANKKTEIFSHNPFDPGLKTHKLNGRMKIFWAFSINYKYRIIFEFLDENNVRFYSIGDHDIYE